MNSIPITVGYCIQESPKLFGTKDADELKVNIRLQGETTSPVKVNPNQL